MAKNQPAEAIARELARIPSEHFTSWRGGWQHSLSLALLDAVYSAQAVYGNGTGKGVLANVKTFQAAEPGATDDLEELHAVGESAIRKIMGSTKTGYRKSKYKSEAVIEATDAFIALGITKTATYTTADFEARRNAYLSVKGLGPVTLRLLRDAPWLSRCQSRHLDTQIR